MINQIEIESFNEKILVQRIIGSVQGSKKTPTVIAIGGIHGNERAGINALLKVFKTINDENIALKGNFYGIAGNINAISENIRFKNVDLNRIWTKKEILKLLLENHLEIESQEQNEIYIIIKNILKTEKGPFYFLDLHTTSSDTKPFITISDSLNNRKYSSYFSIPTILGIEEFLEGPLLTYINEFGHIALGFEAGQHDNEVSVDNCIAFLWLALVAAKCVHKKDVKKYSFYKSSLSLFNEDQDFYKIDYKYTIKPFENFKMVNGYKNFQEIAKHELLANSNGRKIESKQKGKIFMPLYQKKGDDGFFVITRISKFWLKASRLARKLHFHQFLRLLPGVKSDKKNTYTLIVNPKTAKFLATEIFHLFGYRKKVIKGDKYYFIKRDRKISAFI
ncbi:succinylglutamate desuccinylase/aspartoacylase family protein [Polaribacter sp. Hel1_85]|uniref:succinylglutamate desuccinylase/aspartoacylase domain-containing protein n=1 Tax=Polaribacter sp. Hel1_85 TaxID=1250005 RepID=UPI00052CD2BE|nr:succinylglutamate desuccinylase/aspartoacylase family protein [Polaribacter sp. Hel1_85]KGL63516.1 succinylglutamate desuccinylase [Polaribacter sp. Hel1_85]